MKISVLDISSHYVTRHTDADVAKCGLSKKILKRRMKLDSNQAFAQLVVEKDKLEAKLQMNFVNFDKQVIRKMSSAPDALTPV